MPETTDEIPITHLQGASLKTVVQDIWAGGGSLDVEILSVRDDHLDFNVTRCRYAEFYRSLGLADLGYLIHCNRDYAMIDGFPI